jgi:hypothetical protein
MQIIRQILPDDGIVADYRYDPETDKARFVMYLETEKGLQRMAFDPNSTFILSLIAIAKKIALGKM